MSGIFGLGEVRTEQLNNTWPESANYGYFAGGSLPTFVATIDRIDFFNETTSAPGNNLSQERSTLAGVFSSNYGYFGGGSAPPTTIYCTIDRIDFSTETVVGPPIHGVSLTQKRSYVGAVSSSNYSYFAGGYAPSVPGRACTIDRIDFSSETVSLPGPSLTQARQALATVFNSNYGYLAGGYENNRVCTIDRIDFSTETVAAPGTYQLTQARNISAGVYNSNYGYIAGGEIIPGRVCTIDRIDFSSETVSLPGPSLTESRTGIAGVSNSNYGYFGGGYEGPNRVCTIDRIDFSTETVAAPGTYQLTQARNNLAAVSGGKSINARQQYGTPYFSSKLSEAKYGYLMDGFVNEPSPVYTCNIERFDYSNETMTNTGNYSKGGWGVVTVSTPNYGYGFGGDGHCAISRFDFSNESYIEKFIQLGDEVKHGSSAVNANYGYFSRNQYDSTWPTNPDNTLKRLDFSSEVLTSLPNWSSNKRGVMIGMSSKNHGYFWGGGGTFDPGPPSGFPSDSQMERLEFSTEIKSTPITSLSAFPTPEAEKYYGGSSSSFSITDYGYMGNRQDPRHLRYPGGTNHRDIIRFEFSNETLSAPGVLQNNYMVNPSAKIHSGDNGYGYDVGGTDYPYNPHTTPRSCVVDRFDFSNETYSGLLTGVSLVGAKKNLSEYTDTFQSSR